MINEDVFVFNHYLDVTYIRHVILIRKRYFVTVMGLLWKLFSGNYCFGYILTLFLLGVYSRGFFFQTPELTGCIQVQINERFCGYRRFVHVENLVFSHQNIPVIKVSDIQPSEYVMITRKVLCHPYWACGFEAIDFTLS